MAVAPQSRQSKHVIERLYTETAVGRDRIALTSAPVKKVRINNRKRSFSDFYVKDLNLAPN